MTTANQTSTRAGTATEHPGTIDAATHGEVISWDLDAMTFPYSALRDALSDAGLDPKLARAMLPRNAFARVSRKLVEDRVIDRLEEDEAVLKFQFSGKVREGDRLRYEYESVLSLDKATGEITGDAPELAERAKRLFDAELETRRTSDVTRLLQRLFHDKKRNDLDLIPINRRGTYLVRKEYTAYVDQVEDFLGRLNAKLTRMPIAAGVPSGDRCVREAVGDRMRGYVSDLDAAVDEFDPKANPHALKTMVEKVRLLKHKVASYATYLEDERESVDTALAAVQARLTAKVAGVTEGEMADGDGADDVGF